MRYHLLVAITALCVPRAALALKPATHRELAERACLAEQLPYAYCSRIGKAVFEADYREWKDPAAHAQTMPGQDRCAAADAAAQRVAWLAHSAVQQARAGEHELSAIAVGRALHTLQDECAHHGMTNQEHAHYSLADTCGSEGASPDTKPDAIACADERTRAVMAMTARALAGVSWVDVAFACRDQENNDSCMSATLPGIFAVCDFLAEAHDWDGVDTTWNSALVGPALTDAFARGLAGSGLAQSICAGDPAAILPVSPRATVSESAADCNLVDTVCLGKVDEAGELSPYGAEPQAGGCTAAAHPSILVLVLLPIIARRRHRASRACETARAILRADECG